MIAFFIKHRVATAMIFLGVCLAGVLTLKRLPVEMLPDIEIPRLTVITPFEYASPEDVEQLITRHIEEAVSSVTGVENLSSDSMEGLSLVTARFRWGADMDMALVETKEKADLARPQLPQDAGKSVVLKYDPRAEPVMIIAAMAVKGDFQNLRRRIEREIVPLLERVDGVAAVDVMGGYRRQLNVNLDRGKLYAHNLSPGEVVRNIGEANYSFPSGFIEKSGKEYLVRTVGEFSRTGQIEEVVVGRNEVGVPIRVKDIGVVEDGYKDRRCIIRRDGRDAVGILVRKEPGKNTIAVCAGVAAGLREMQSAAARDFSLVVVDDRSVFIQSAVKSVLNAALIGSIIVFGVLAFFLKNITYPLIILSSLPVSVLGTFALMYFRGISINTMSLGGLALGVGMMVDAGIVVLEAVAREEESRPGDAAAAALRGTKRVILPVSASIFTTIVVFLPLVYTEGLSGILFGELALTVSFSLLCSLVCSIMLVPMLASLGRLSTERIPGKWAPVLNYTHGRLISAADGFIDHSQRIYSRLNHYARHRPRQVLAAGLAAFLIGNAFLLLIDKELFPAVDAGEFTVDVELPRGSSLDESSRFSSYLEDLLVKDPCVRGVYAKIGSDPDDTVAERASARGVNSVFIHVFLKKDHPRGTGPLMEDIQKRLTLSDRIRARFSARDGVLGTLFDGQAGDLTVEVSGRDRNVLIDIGNAVKSIMEGRAGITCVRSSLDAGRPELRVLVDRSAMSSLGLTVESIALSVRAAINGEIATRYREHDEEADVRVRLREADRSDRESLELVPLKNAEEGMLPLGKIAVVVETTGPVSIPHGNQQRINLVSADIRGSRSRETRRIERELMRLPVQENYEVRLVGMKSDIARSINDMLFSFLLAILLVYMLLASQFQSLKSPLIIMLSIPVAFLGASALLALSGATVNINSGIGLVMLAGIVVNNGIMLFDGIERGRRRGLPKVEAIEAAGRERLVPIFMTTLSTVLALLPMALGLGEGAELQRPLALAVIGGMLVSTILSLVLIPTVYALLAYTDRAESRGSLS